MFVFQAMVEVWETRFNFRSPHGSRMRFLVVLCLIFSDVLRNLVQRTYRMLFYMMSNVPE